MKKELLDSLRYDISLLGLRVSNHVARIDEKIEGIESTLDELSNVYKEQRQEPDTVSANDSDWYFELVDSYHKTNNSIKQMSAEKKIREAIIEKLEKQQNANSCACGDTCQAYDNGFQDAINTIRDM